jgi:RNA polymerase sigma factor (sigma-70 family)
MSVLTEENIIDLIRSESLSSREKGYRELYQLLKPKAFRTLGSFFPPSEHDEIWQMALIHLIKAIQEDKFRLRTNVPVYAFFRQVLLRTGYRYMQSLKKFSSEELEMEINRMSTDPEAYSEAAEESEQHLEKLNGCMEKLSGQNLTILSAFYYENKSIREIHEASGLREGTVRQRLLSIRKQLYNCLTSTQK